MSYCTVSGFKPVILFDILFTAAFALFKYLLIKVVNVIHGLLLLFNILSPI